MEEDTIIKDSDWLFPKNLKTPNRVSSGPLLYRILKHKESYGAVNVDLFSNELGNIMKSYEARMGTFYILIEQLDDEKKEVQTVLHNLKSYIEPVILFGFRDTKNVWQRFHLRV